MAFFTEYLVQLLNDPFNINPFVIDDDDDDPWDSILRRERFLIAITVPGLFCGRLRRPLFALLGASVVVSYALFHYAKTPNEHPSRIISLSDQEYED